MIARYVGVAVFFVGLAGAAQSDEKSIENSMHQGLEVRFEPVCQSGEIWLNGALSNSGDVPIEIENGVFPWDSNQLGTAFEVISSGESLKRRSVFTPVGRIGPVVIPPGGRQSGQLPIEFLYPEVKSYLAKQAVWVNWEYWTSNESNNHQRRIKGSVRLDKSPCQN